jgi:hypothetical protein
MTKTKKFDPETFIGPGWSIESDNGFNPDTLDGIELRHFLKDDERYITGEDVLKRIGNAKALNADAFLRLWENKDLIPKEWYKPAIEGWIEFPGTVLRDPGGSRRFLYLHRRRAGSWDWYCRWLDDVRGRDDVSPLLASSLALNIGRSDPLPLELPAELTINGYLYRRV